MTVKKLIIWPSSKLTRKSIEVTKFDAKLRQLIVDMHQTMNYVDNTDGPDAAGLSACQIGELLRVFVYKLDGDSTCMINPKIIDASPNFEIEPEGCLSFPGVYVKVKRSLRITIEFQDVDGNINQLKTNGFTARCIQHEIDHLDGITYLHVLSKLKKDIVTKKMKKAKKHANPIQNELGKRSLFTRT